HVPALTTGAHPIAALADQPIEPYTDLLLHDLGDGLADGRPDFAASGHEWRTPPLWGLGLVETVLPGATYLHDGRARTIAEAILWHGGEAEAARERFRTAAGADRDALLAFLRSL
ncbi:MAG: thiol oxidoreductase, partial [Myxococcota bacterium]|nr:thiol oxidoreductase [Myxococcota bacterium]